MTRSRTVTMRTQRGRGHRDPSEIHQFQRCCDVCDHDAECVNPDGAVNLASMNQDIAAWKELGELQGPASAEAVVDNSFVNAAVAQLGRYRR